MSLAIPWFFSRQQGTRLSSPFLSCEDDSYDKHCSAFSDGEKSRTLRLQSKGAVLLATLVVAVMVATTCSYNNGGCRISGATAGGSPSPGSTGMPAGTVTEAPDAGAAVIVVPRSVTTTEQLECTGGIVEHSNRNAANPCVGGKAEECDYVCDPGYFPIGSLVCQTTVPIDHAQASAVWAFAGGRCARLCKDTAAACDQGTVPLRKPATDVDGACFVTTCRTPGAQLLHLGRSNWEVWRMGRNEKTGIYVDHVNLEQPAHQPWHQGGLDMTGLGIIFECVAEAMGWQTRAEAQARVTLTLSALAGELPDFKLPRNAGGWSTVFFDSNTGATIGIGNSFSMLSTGLNTAGVLFAKTYYSRTDAQSPMTANIRRLADKVYNSVQWHTILCQDGKVDPDGNAIPMLQDDAGGCSAEMYPAADGYYNFNEMHYTAWLTYHHTCGDKPVGQCSNKAIERMWDRWQARRLHPNKVYAGNSLLSDWSSYLVQLPYYTVHSFNADSHYKAFFESHWKADMAYYKNSYMGQRGRYGLGAGPTIQWCAGARYEADRIVAPQLAGGGCRMYSPYSLTGYMPVAQDIIKQQILELLEDGETVTNLPGGQYSVLNRRSVRDESFTQGYGITLVDFSSELFGLSTLWLSEHFYVHNTKHFPEQPLAEVPV